MKPFTDVMRHCLDSSESAKTHVDSSVAFLLNFSPHILVFGCRNVGTVLNLDTLVLTACVTLYIPFILWNEASC